jgi:hypothetical protein
LGTQVDGNVIVELLKNRSNLTKLQLSSTPGISDESIEIIIKSFPNLTDLYFNDEYAITYNQLVNLATACPKLKEYFFDYDNISQDEFTKFYNDFPGCKLYPA